jgi:hypothetical protein
VSEFREGAPALQVGFGCCVGVVAKNRLPQRIRREQAAVVAIPAKHGQQRAQSFLGIEVRFGHVSVLAVAAGRTGGQARRSAGAV